jgi:hypothetical protein
VVRGGDRCVVGGGGEVAGGSAEPRTPVFPICGQPWSWPWPKGLLKGVAVAGRCQPVAAGSALRRSNAALSSVTQGHVFCRWSLARRPENASRAATCSSR